MGADASEFFLINVILQIIIQTNFINSLLSLPVRISIRITPIIVKLIYDIIATGRYCIRMLFCLICLLLPWVHPRQGAFVVCLPSFVLVLDVHVGKTVL